MGTTAYPRRFGNGMSCREVCKWHVLQVAQGSASVHVSEEWLQAMKHRASEQAEQHSRTRAVLEQHGIRVGEARKHTQLSPVWSYC